jgi:hypothetical protein
VEADPAGRIAGQINEYALSPRRWRLYFGEGGSLTSATEITSEVSGLGVGRSGDLEFVGGQAAQITQREVQDLIDDHAALTRNLGDPELTALFMDGGR